MSEELKNAVIELREDDALRIADEELQGGTDPLEVVAACREAMDVIGQRFADGEAFIPELIMGGEIMQAISQEVLPDGGAPDAGGAKGTVVIGTVRGDIHDIGKDIVVLLLGMGGYAVHDLGIDVPVEDFVAAVRERKARIVALSGLLTLAFDSMKSTVEGIAAAGLRDQVRIMIGGAAVDANVCAYTGADGWGSDVGHAVRLADEWTDGGA